MLNILIWMFLGIIAGTITGLTPGIHINLIATALLSIPITLDKNPTTIIVFIVAMAITHTFLDFIPAIFLGVPDEDTALGVMPGHDFLLKGKAYEAVLLTLIGSTVSTALLIIIIPIFIFTIPKIYPFLEVMMSFVLIWISIFLISRDKNSKTWACLIFILSGFLGITTLNLPIKNALLPLLTGLFGSSTIIYSITQNVKIPKQKIGKILFTKKELFKPIIATSIVSPICSFFPGLGSSQAAIIGSEITRDMTKKQFLILIGSIKTLVMSTSFFTLYILHKSRTGAASTIQQITTLTSQNLTWIISAIIISSIVSILLTIKTGKIFAKNIHKIDYTKISIIILIFISILIFCFSGPLGFLVFIIATALGLTCIYAQVQKSHLMGSLLIPTILIYLPWI